MNDIIIDKTSKRYTQKQIKYFEKKYGGRFILESSFIDKNNRATDSTFLFYYNEVKHPEGSNYYAIGVDETHFFITNGICIEDMVFNGFMEGNIFKFSKHRHDYVSGSHGESVDGGRDYTRFNKTVFSKFISIKIKNGLIVVVNENEETNNSKAIPIEVEKNNHFI
jgi:hypothetical protein